MARLLFFVVSFSLLQIAMARATDELTPKQKQFRDIYKELIEINTTDSVGDTKKAAEAMAARLKAGGIPAADIRVFSTAPRKGNVVARLRGSSAKKPLLLLAHMDVVEAKREDWDFDPFKLQEVDGFFRARGAIDDKSMAAIFVANLIELKKEEFKPNRDIILALTTDEEMSDSPNNGVRYLLANHRDLIDAEFAINEGGSGSFNNGEPERMSLQLAEKVYQTFKLEAKDSGGHSAAPKQENAIYRLAAALQHLQAYSFPLRLNDITRHWFEKAIESQEQPVADAIRAVLAENTQGKIPAPLQAMPGMNSMLHTTCVATMIEGGHAENALPQTARATVNCRIMPEETIDNVQQRLTQVIDDPKIMITPVGKAVLSPPSPPNLEIINAVTQIMNEMWPGVPLIPSMSGGYTDGRWLRNVGIPTYGISGLFSVSNSGVHGLNEQVGVKELYESKEFLYRLIKVLAGASSSSRG